MPRAVGVAQDQLARGAYAFEDGLDERAVGAAGKGGFCLAGTCVSGTLPARLPFRPVRAGRSGPCSRHKRIRAPRGRSNVRPLATAIDTGLGSAGLNARWLTLMPMPAIVRARVGPE